MRSLERLLGALAVTGMGGERGGRRRLWRGLVACSLIAGLGGAGLTQEATAASGPLLAVAIKGDIYVARADGGMSRRLTTYGLNSRPALSPHQRLVAYLSIPGGYGDSIAGGTAHNIWLAASDGSTADRVAGLDPSHDRAGLTWSPDGRYLAYFQGANLLLYDAIASTTRTLIRGVHLSGSPSSPIAWSPDGNSVAAERERSSGKAPGSSIVLAIAVPGGGAVTYSTITFPPQLLSANPGNVAPPGSYPSADGLAWTADGKHVLVSTVGRGEGFSLTGIWQAPATGGNAKLLVGTPAVIRQQSGTSGPLKDATSFELSPDRRHLATDPDAGRGNTRDYRLWIGDAAGKAGRYLDLHLSGHPNCVLAQYGWLVTGTGLAYVVTCSGTLGSAGSSITSYLFTVAVDGTAIHQLAEVADPSQDALQVANGERCVQCGG